MRNETLVLSFFILCLIEQETRVHNLQEPVWNSNFFLLIRLHELSLMSTVERCGVSPHL